MQSAFGDLTEHQEPWEALGSVFWGDLMTLSVDNDTWLLCGSHLEARSGGKGGRGAARLQTRLFGLTVNRLQAEIPYSKI